MTDELRVRLNDLPLFGEGNAPLAHMARTSDPDTSKDAAVNAQEWSAKDRAAIVRALRYFGVGGATAKEIAKYLDQPDDAWDNVRVSRRIAEARKAGELVSFDGKMYAGVMRPVVKRQGCAVHVLKEHSAAASAIFAAERARKERDATVERRAS